jgi:hypothetical protein
MNVASNPVLLPDSRPRVQRNVQWRVNNNIGMNWVPIYCANCGAPGGLVPEQGCNFCFYLCDPCAIKLPPIDGTYMIPDHVFWENVKQEQLARYGRELTPEEMAEVLKDGENPLTKLCRDRKDFSTVQMT